MQDPTNHNSFIVKWALWLASQLVGYRIAALVNFIVDYKFRRNKSASEV